MTPFAVFFKTLSRTSAVFIGVALVFLHPPLDWGADRTVTAKKGPRQATIDGLAYAMRDTDAGVRRAVARALEAYAAIDAQRAIASELTTQLSSPDPAARARAACGLREIGREAATALDALVAMLGDDAPVEQSGCGGRWRVGLEWLTTPGEQAAAALAEIGRPSVDPLLRALKHTSAFARRNAAWALGAIGEKSAIPALIEALKDESPKVREQAAWALGKVTK